MSEITNQNNQNENNEVIAQQTQPVQQAQPIQLTSTVGANLQIFRECFALAKVYCMAAVVPDSYRNRPADTAVALDMACRMGVSPLMVMQNLYVVQGKPSWSGQACMAFIRANYHNVKVIYIGDRGTDNRGCYIKAVDSDGDIIEGTAVTMGMARAEGWLGKRMSKWQTMPEQMLAYRAAAFFARVHCPELLMGCAVEGESVEETSGSAAKTATNKRPVEDVL